MAYKNIEDKRRYPREYMRERRAWLRDHHFCTECKTQDAYTLAGHAHCFDCAHRRRKNPLEYIPPERVETERVIYPPGSCYKCGQPVKTGTTRWGGEPFKVCERCYEDSVRAAAKGREQFQEVYGFTWGQMQYVREHLPKMNG